jgi:hypothetical protein
VIDTHVSAYVSDANAGGRWRPTVVERPWPDGATIRAKAQLDTEPKGGLSDRAVIDRYVARIIVRPDALGSFFACRKQLCPEIFRIGLLSWDGELSRHAGILVLQNPEGSPRDAFP